MAINIFLIENTLTRQKGRCLLYRNATGSLLSIEHQPAKKKKNGGMTVL